MASKMDFESLIDTPRKQAMLGISIAFMIVFPLYFQVMPSLIDDDLLASSSGGGARGGWVVTFNEVSIELSESVNLGDGDSHDSFFDVESEFFIGYVEVFVTCNDNDDPGPGFSDSVDGTSDVSGVDGEFDDQSDSGTCGGGNSGFTMGWDVTSNYTGESYQIEDVSEGDIRAEWNDGGFGRGTWALTITADISAPPGIGGFVDSNEDYDITWTAVTYEVVLEPIVDL